MRGLRVAVVLLVGCSGAVAVSESGGDAGTSTPDASTPREDAGGVADATVDATIVADSASDTGTDAAMDAVADSAIEASVDAGTDAAVETVVSAAAGDRQSCFVMSSGKLYCAGFGNATPTPVAGVTDAVEVAIGGGYGAFVMGAIWGGGFFRCFRRAGGTVECAGANDLGQLGDGTMDFGSGMKTSRSTFAPVVGLTDAVQISAGTGNSACARRATGAVVCWGGNYAVALGDGTTAVARPLPTPVSGLTDAIDISVGLWGACAVRATGQAACWGNNERGELGSTTDYGAVSSVPVAVPGITDAVAIARGPYFAHVIRADGSVWGWGMRGPWIGAGYTEVTCPISGSCGTPPVEVAGLTATKLSASGGHYNSAHGAACALRPTGVVSCWGSNVWGEIGIGAPDSTYPNVPADALGIADAMGIARGARSTCAIRPAGRVSCWGRNDYGQLGNGTMVTPAAPTDVVW